MIIYMKELIWEFWFLRGRLMTDDFQLKDRAKQWIKAIKSQYVAVDPSR